METNIQTINNSPAHDSKKSRRMRMPIGIFVFAFAVSATLAAAAGLRKKGSSGSPYFRVNYDLVQEFYCASEPLKLGAESWRDYMAMNLQLDKNVNRHTHTDSKRAAVDLLNHGRSTLFKDLGDGDSDDLRTYKMNRESAAHDEFTRNSDSTKLLWPETTKHLQEAMGRPPVYVERTRLSTADLNVAGKTPEPSFIWLPPTSAWQALGACRDLIVVVGKIEIPLLENRPHKSTVYVAPVAAVKFDPSKSASVDFALVAYEQGFQALYDAIRDSQGVASKSLGLVLPKKKSKKDKSSGRDGLDEIRNWIFNHDEPIAFDQVVKMLGNYEVYYQDKRAIMVAVSALKFLDSRLRANEDRRAELAKPIVTALALHLRISDQPEAPRICASVPARDITLLLGKFLCGGAGKFPCDRRLDMRESEMRRWKACASRVVASEQILNDIKRVLEKPLGRQLSEDIGSLFGMGSKSSSSRGKSSKSRSRSRDKSRSSEGGPQKAFFRLLVEKMVPTLHASGSSQFGKRIESMESLTESQAAFNLEEMLSELAEDQRARDVFNDMIDGSEVLAEELFMAAGACRRTDAFRDFILPALSSGFDRNLSFELEALDGEDFSADTALNGSLRRMSSGGSSTTIKKGTGQRQSLDTVNFGDGGRQSRRRSKSSRSRSRSRSRKGSSSSSGSSPEEVTRV